MWRKYSDEERECNNREITSQLMETVYEKYKTSSEYLMEYYTWVDLLGIERREFEEH